jgi:hypothetical protein
MPKRRGEGDKIIKLASEILLNGEKQIIPFDYRQSMICLIKEAISSSPHCMGIFERYFLRESAKVDPFPLQYVLR